MRGFAVKLLDRVREKMRLHHYAWATEQSHVDWIERSIVFHQCGDIWRHPTVGAQPGRELLCSLQDKPPLCNALQLKSILAFTDFARRVAGCAISTSVNDASGYTSSRALRAVFGRISGPKMANAQTAFKSLRRFAPGLNETN